MTHVGHLSLRQGHSRLITQKNKRIVFYIYITVISYLFFELKVLFVIVQCLIGAVYF